MGVYASMLLADLVDPKDGEVIVNRYWLVLPDGGGALFFATRPRYGWAPQCNRNFQVVAAVQRSCQVKDTIIQHIPVAFIGYSSQEGRTHKLLTQVDI